jgi:precorrin-6Y C5,15-methyltransferase (decarboxylating)
MTNSITALDIVSMGVGNLSSLPSRAIHAINTADTIIGAEHHFVSLKGINITGTQIQYASPFSQVKQQLLSLSGRVVILASGDSLFFGIGQWVNTHFSHLEATFHVNVSSIQAACHLISKPWQALKLLTAHGRPLTNIRSALQNNRLYGLLTDKNSQPNDVAAILRQAGFGDSTLWICEAIGSPQQRVTECSVGEILDDEKISPLTNNRLHAEFHPLHVTIFETSGKGNILPEFPGITDTSFSTDGAEKGSGLITKKEVRINILSLLQPTAGDIGWDIGAGCGGVSVEWARWNKEGKVYGIEYHPERLHHLKENQRRFGVANNLNIIEGRAPQALNGLPNPQKIFIGGSGGELTSILTLCWEKLSTNGKLVIACVTENNKSSALNFAQDLTTNTNTDAQKAITEIVQVSVSKGGTLADQLVLRPQLPVLLISITKIRQKH